jgi:ligand-binding SRPBCC domain-containing protein
LKFRHRFTVCASQDAVAKFHADPRVLRTITPLPIIVQFHHVEPIAEGTEVDFTLWFGPIPVRWIARHSHIRGHQGFVDEQMRGPFKEWIHVHRFETTESGSVEVVDEIDAKLRAHPWWGLVGGMMWITLPILFVFRAWQTRRILERGQSA